MSDYCDDCGWEKGCGVSHRAFHGQRGRRGDMDMGSSPLIKGTPNYEAGR